MYDHNQFDLPPSFVALYLEPGRTRPSASRAEISRRYDLCEDLAHRLFEYARAQFHDLGITEEDVLRRCHLGLCAEPRSVDAREANWVVHRLAELQGWGSPDWLQPV